MKSLNMKVACLFLFSLISLLSGCTALEIADMIFDDDCRYRGTVEQVDHRDSQTFVKFDDSNTVYQCATAEWVAVGGWIEVRDMQNNGCIFSR